ncbi:15-cis-zeta-carotene isomerase, chloroplastic [Galdieria sulphuraria]|nr:15-cis-zeta-carotene isomerase, chloroplastic [Galdieria sulphuraria]
MAFLDCFCQCNRKIASCFQRKLHCHISKDSLFRAGVFLSPVGSCSFLATKRVGVQANCNKCSERRSQWCLYVSALLSASACLFPVVCVYFDSNTSFNSNFQTLLDKYTSHYTIIGLQVLFSTVHSGLASLRPSVTKLLGERLYRIGFAVSSLPLAVVMIGYFVTHRYDGIILWQIRNIPGIHELVWLLSFISFYFLYPGTFRLLEIAAIQKPELHLFGEGIMRITRHPQLWGQILWCIGHMLWLGSSFSVVTSLCLVSYHFFGAWHGDQRLKMESKSWLFQSSFIQPTWLSLSSLFVFRCPQCSLSVSVVLRRLRSIFQIHA